MISFLIFGPLLLYLYHRWAIQCWVPFPLVQLTTETIVLVIGAINMCVLCEGMRRRRQQPSTDPLEFRDISQPPSVLVIVPTNGEGVGVIQRTVNALKELAYPDDKLTVVISDDGKDDEIRDYILFNSNFSYRRRMHIFGDAKAGNLNDTLFERDPENIREFLYKGDFVLVLDCDMAPVPEMLHVLVPYMYNPATRQIDTIVAFVQSHQNFDNIRGIDFLGQHYYFFYRVVMKAWDGFQLGVPCCGTNALFSRRLLMINGGFQTGSLTEDFKTSLRFHYQKYTSKYCDRVLATGFAPLTFLDFCNQRSRWALGGLQIVFSSAFHEIRRLPLAHQWIYGFSGLSPIMSVFLATLMICPLISFALQQSHLCGLDAFNYVVYFMPYVGCYVLMLVYLYRGLSIQVMILSIQETLFMVPIFLRILGKFFFRALRLTELSWKTTPKLIPQQRRPQMTSTIVQVLPYVLYVAASVSFVVYYGRDGGDHDDLWIVNTSWIAFMNFQLLPVFGYLIQQTLLLPGE